MNDFALAPRTDLLNFKCHTVTNGTDLRKSPQKKKNKSACPSSQSYKGKKFQVFQKTKNQQQPA